ncbi:ROK family protein [Sphaerisporangium dianthi]|uniref:ROK family protein n=1 Tax=Sphaerisporangium dianthi TaxID=1436120 RepID=A0ABV9CGM3_9ACTN
MSPKSYVVALDVGGTSMKGGLVASDGEVLLTDRRPTPRDEGPQRVIEAIRTFIDDLARSGRTLPSPTTPTDTTAPTPRTPPTAGGSPGTAPRTPLTPGRPSGGTGTSFISDVPYGTGTPFTSGRPSGGPESPVTSGMPAGVGLAVPGLVNSDTALYAANIGWKDVPATEFTSLDVPVRLGHDVRTGGLAERVLGAGRSEPDFLFLPIGTGIAGASIVHGEPYGGSAGWGGEIGHIPVFPDGERCACGQVGCLETYASAASVARRYSERLSRAASLRSLTPPLTGPAPAAEDVVALAMRGDPHASAVWDEALEALSLALASYTLLLDPSSIVIGGGLAEAGPALFEPLAERLQSRLGFRPAPPLRHAALGMNAGMLGAALLGWQAAGIPDVGSTWALDVLRSPSVP